MTFLIRECQMDLGMLEKSSPLVAELEIDLFDITMI